jgi:fructose-1,6-bisphosphatase/inositol monophosphatase family enzyme
MSRRSPQTILEIFDELMAEVADGLSDLRDWGHSGARPGQYHHDVLADEIVLDRLHRAGFQVLSEESGLTGEGDILVVVDPVDGSTNASRALPWYATSLCAVDDDGPLAADVVNLATGDRFRAIRGMGAEAEHVALGPSGCTDLSQALIACSGLPPQVAEDLAQVVQEASKLFLKSVIFVPAPGVTIAWNGGQWSEVETLLTTAGFTVQTVPGQNRSTVSWT